MTFPPLSSYIQKFSYTYKLASKWFVCSGFLVAPFLHFASFLHFDKHALPKCRLNIISKRLPICTHFVCGPNRKFALWHLNVSKSFQDTKLHVLSLLKEKSVPICISRDKRLSVVDVTIVGKNRRFVSFTRCNVKIAIVSFRFGGLASLRRLCSLLSFTS